jgi:hypothetical protein
MNNNNDNDDTKQTKALAPQWTGGGRWPKGYTGNLAGRGHVPSKFSKRFLISLAASWEQHGDAVFEEVRKTDVVQYLRICASLVPKEVILHTHSSTPAAQLTEQELQAVIVEDITGVERLRTALLPLVARVAELDPVLADEMQQVIDG